MIHEIEVDLSASSHGKVKIDGMEIMCNKIEICGEVAQPTSVRITIPCANIKAKIYTKRLAMMIKGFLK